jgi:hypothetical protein
MFAMVHLAPRTDDEIRMHNLSPLSGDRAIWVMA